MRYKYTFKDRVEAGRRLARKLERFRGKDVIVLAIPRGGVVVGYEVAKVLGAPLDLIIPRKLRAPFQSELAIGAVAQDGTVILNEKLVETLKISDSYLREEKALQIKEIERRMKRYRGDRAPPALKDRVVVVVDDGIATGATMRAAIASIRRCNPTAVVVTVPVAPPDTVRELSGEADEVVCLAVPTPFYAIGQFYLDFGQTSDEEVVELLES